MSHQRPGSLYEILCLYVKWFGRESADELTDGKMETQKHRTDSITSTTDVGGNDAGGKKGGV